MNHPTAKSAHDANNAVIKAALDMAKARGVTVAVAVSAQVEGKTKQIVGVDYTREEVNVEGMIQLLMVGAGALRNRMARAVKAALDGVGERAFAAGVEMSDALLDRDRTGEEDLEADEDGGR
jgi:hypothetical protein